jgi:hypothetical protein
LYDYVHTEPDRVTINELLSSNVGDAVEFISSHFMEIHAERASDITELRLRTSDDELILCYATHFDAIAAKD